MRNDFFWSVGYCFNVHVSICNLDVRPQESAEWPFYCCLYDTQVLASSRLWLSPLVSRFHCSFGLVRGLFLTPALLRATSWCFSLEFWSFAGNWNEKSSLASQTVISLCFKQSFLFVCCVCCVVQFAWGCDVSPSALLLLLSHAFTLWQ